MAIKVISEHDQIIWKCKPDMNINWHSKFEDVFSYVKKKEGVYVLKTKTKEDCLIGNGFGYHDISYDLAYVRGKKLENNKIVCEDDINVISMTRLAAHVEFGRKQRCLLTLLASVGSKLHYGQEVLELNFNEDDINNYLNERQIEKFKEEIKVAELKKALKQIAKKRLMEEGVLCDEEHKRPYIPQDVVGLVYMRYDGKCCKCGSSKDLQLDHIIPFSKGGSSEVDNLQLLCKDCNIRKGNNI